MANEENNPSLEAVEMALLQAISVQQRRRGIPTTIETADEVLDKHARAYNVASDIERGRIVRELFYEYFPGAPQAAREKIKEILMRRAGLSAPAVEPETLLSARSEKHAAIESASAADIAITLCRFVDRSGKSVRQVGRESGIAFQIFQNWLDGRYVPYDPQLVEQFRATLALKPREAYELKRKIEKHWGQEEERAVRLREEGNAVRKEVIDLFMHYMGESDSIHNTDIAPSPAVDASRYISRMREGKHIPTDGDVDRLALAHGGISSKDIEQLKEKAGNARTLLAQAKSVANAVAQMKASRTSAGTRSPG